MAETAHRTIEIADIFLPGPLHSTSAEAESWINDLKPGDVLDLDEGVTVFTHDGSRWQRHVIPRNSHVMVTCTNMTAMVYPSGKNFLPFVGIDLEFSA